MSDKEPKDHMDTWVNRTLCGVLEDMRRSIEALSFGNLKGLIEEAQVYGNRMEAALENNKDLKKGHERLAKLKKEYNKLADEYNELLEKANEQERKNNSEPDGKSEVDSKGSGKD